MTGRVGGERDVRHGPRRRGRNATLFSSLLSCLPLFRPREAKRDAGTRVDALYRLEREAFSFSLPRPCESP